jgi:hypothetical protein
MKVLFEVAKKSDRILFCHSCQSTLKYRSGDLYTKVVTLSYDGSDKFLYSYIDCPVCGAAHHLPKFDKPIYS